jgi:hypothetical protein
MSTSDPVTFSYQTIAPLFRSSSDFLVIVGSYSAPFSLLVTSFTLSTPEFNLGTFKGLFR